MDGMDGIVDEGRDECDTLGRAERLGRGANGGGEEDDEPP